MQKCNNLELRDVNSVTTTTKKVNRCRSFHFRYLELCRAKNLTPLPEIRTKNNVTTVLDFFGDKLSVNDWLLIVEALYYDQVLQSLGIHMRKNFGIVLDSLDTEKKAKLFRQRPVLYTKFVFTGIVEAVSNCIEYNKHLQILNLEGLPLSEKYIESIAKALSSNNSLKEISFQRSNIFDKGCEAICNTIKYLEHVERLNLSDCELTTKGAEFIADMIKIQKISRYTEGWQKSLRYRDVDPDTIPGLRSISIARNPHIGDDGVKYIVEVLKEDVWIKVIDMEMCGLTDRAANMILDCLEINHYIIDFNVRNNNAISKFLQRNIREQLGKEDDDPKGQDNQHLSNKGIKGLPTKQSKLSVNQLKEQVKTLEEQLSFERTLRKKAEQLNDKLNQQIIAYENQFTNETKSKIPEGYVVVKNDSLQSIIKERNDFQKLVTSGASNQSTPRNIKNSNLNSKRSIIKKTNQYIDTNYIEENEAEYDKQQKYDVHHQNLQVINQHYSTQNTPSKDTRKSLKVRKVKSEMKYIELPMKDNKKDKKKESKSDHEFAFDSDFPSNVTKIERNIGDTMDNYNSGQNSDNCRLSIIHNSFVTEHCNEKKNNYHPNIYNNNNEDNNNNNKNFNNIINSNIIHSNEYYYDSTGKIEMDSISLPTTRSCNSDQCSSDSDTLRNDTDKRYQPLKVFIRRPKTVTIPPLANVQANYEQQVCCGSGDCHQNSIRNVKSPRTLFLGLSDD